MKLENLIYCGRNIIIQWLQQYPNGKLVIVGSGHTLSTDSDGNVIFTEPGFKPPKKIRGYGKKCNIFVTYFPADCEGLESAGLELATYITNYLRDYKKIILHGHSKSAITFTNLAKWLDYDFFRSKVSFVAVSPPFNGTIMANLNAICEKAISIKNAFYSKLFCNKAMVFAIFGDITMARDFVQRIPSFLEFVFVRLFSNLQVDKDICPDSDFIKTQDKETYKEYENNIVVSVCGFTLHPIDWVLKLVDILGDIHGDGIVPVLSQIPDHEHDLIIASHATAMKKSQKFVKKLLND